MSIRRKISREIFFNMPPRNREARIKLAAKLSRLRVRPSHQKIQPKPRKASKRYFEAARPVHADGIWVLAMPVLPLAKQFRGILLIAGQPKCLRQRHQMLMTIQFPCDLDVSNLGEIKIVNLEPRFARRLFSMHPVKVPVDFRPVVEVSVAEQIKTVLAYPLGSLDDLICFLGKPLSQSCT